MRRLAPSPYTADNGMDTDTSSTNPETETFEQALSRLEEIVRKLDDPTVSIDESVELYREGLRLSRICTTRLETASQKIEEIRTQEQLHAEASTDRDVSG